MERLGLAAVFALVAQFDLETAVEKRHFPQACGKDVVVKLGDGKYLRVGLERDFRAGFSACFACFLEAALGDAARVLLLPCPAVTPDFKKQ